MSVRINKFPAWEIRDFGCTRFQDKPFGTNMQNNILSNARGGHFFKKALQKCVQYKRHTKIRFFRKFPKIFSVPFGCTYLFWDNLTHTIQKFMQFRAKSIPISCSDNKNPFLWISLKFTHFSKKRPFLRYFRIFCIYVFWGIFLKVSKIFH